jgi:CubicO group peptidase (beta-lactamase class C family)
LSFQDRFDILLEKRLSGVAEQGNTMYMGNPLIGSRSIANTADNASSEAELLRNKRTRDFQDCELYPKGQYGCYFIFGQDTFPEIQWRNPDLVEKVIGKFPLKVRWFDPELNEVSVPGKPGRYAAVIEGTSSNGVHIWRAITVYHRPKDWRPWRDNPKVYVEYLPGSPFNKTAWEERKDLIASYSGKLFFELMTNEPQGAVLMSYLTEMKPLGRKPTKIETPEIQDDDYHLALKRKLLGVENKYPPLKMPHKIQGKPAPVLRTGSPEEAGVKPDTAQKLRKICQQFYGRDKGPFVVLVARNGVIIIHEAFGERPQGPVKIDTPIGIFSMTKTLSGVMFAQFVDQGLITLDDPVGKFLPDFPIEGNKAITVRHCFTHTSGLEGHFKWGGMRNPWLDNVIANGLPCLEPGRTFKYNGMGYDLAGKVMEIVSGKSIFRLMHENLFGPLGMKNTTMDDMASATTSIAEDIAKISQLLLNKGSYGDLEFFSPKTFEKLLPRSLEKFYPTINKEWGIGLKWMHLQHPDAGKSVPGEKTILSRNVIGHTGGQRAEMLVDLDKDLVIVHIHSQNRPRGKAFNEFKVQFFTALDNSLVK